MMYFLCFFFFNLVLCICNVYVTLALACIQLISNRLLVFIDIFTSVCFEYKRFSFLFFFLFVSTHQDSLLYL